MKPIRLSLLAVAVVALLGACSSASGGGAAAGADADADFTITSVDMEFDQDTLTVPADEPFTLALVNEDTMPHNVSIYTDSSASEDLFIGEVVTEGSIVYEIPALEPGEYFFKCDLHPEMSGTVVVQG